MKCLAPGLVIQDARTFLRVRVCLFVILLLICVFARKNLDTDLKTATCLASYQVVLFSVTSNYLDYIALCTVHNVNLP